MKICNETGVFMEKKRTVIKVGTSTLTYENGKINYRRVEQLCKVLSLDLYAYSGTGEVT